MTLLATEQLFRWCFVGIFIGAVAISVYFRRRARRFGEAIPRAREGKLALLTAPSLRGPTVPAYLGLHGESRVDGLVCNFPAHVAALAGRRSWPGNVAPGLLGVQEYRHQCLGDFSDQRETRPGRSWPLSLGAPSLIRRRHDVPGRAERAGGELVHVGDGWRGFPWYCRTGDSARRDGAGTEIW